MNISIFKDLFKSKDVPYIIDISVCLDRIKKGKSKDLINLIRKEKDKEKRNELKKKLPCIIFSGEFNKRSKKGFIKHSGLVILDFDNIPKDDINTVKDKLTTNQYIYSVFTSPSGNGLKALLKSKVINEKHHEQVYKSFIETLNLDYIDSSGCNIDRVCFESYDPKIYINKEAETYLVNYIDEGFNATEKSPVLPVTDEYKIISIIENFNYKTSFSEGQRNEHLFTVASHFCEYGIAQYTCEDYFLSANTGGLKEHEIKSTIKSAYKSRVFNSKFFEDTNKIQNIKLDLKKGEKYVKEKYNLNNLQVQDISEEVKSSEFWSYDKKGNVNILNFEFKYFLEENGFRKYYPDTNAKPVLVRVLSNKVEIVNEFIIKDFTLNYVLSKSESKVYNKLAGSKNLFKEDYLNFLENVEIKILKDKKDISYLCFKNCVVEIKKNDFNIIDYLDLDGYVWKSNIINRDFKKAKDDNNDFKQYINNISAGEALSFESVIGYMLSTYKNLIDNRAIILNDEKISDTPEGGTGKGLFAQGLMNIRKTASLDGKTFDDKKSFPYQTVSEDTNILVFDDVKKNFNFETKFSLITEGITLERKNKDAIKLTVEDSPKILISTNYPIKGGGNSHDRRRFELELTHYYNKNKTPYDDFGRQLFRDWDSTEFLKFDNYIIKCIQSYLKLGLVKQNSKNFKLRKLASETSTEFLEYVNDGFIKQGVRYNKPDIHEAFTNEYKDFKNSLKSRTFVRWCKLYANLLNIEFYEGNSNGKRWFSIGLTNEDEADEIPF